MLLQILRALGRLPTKPTLVRPQGEVFSNMGYDLITFYRCCRAFTPMTYYVEVIGTLATNVALTDMFLMETK